MDGLSAEQRRELDSLTPEQRERYASSRRKGQSHNFAIIAASQRCPGIPMRDERMRLSQDARRMGVRGASGKYQGALARFPGDPRAFVSSMAEARRVCDQLSSEEGCDVRLSDGPEHGGTGRQDLLRRARAGDNRAQAELARELEVA